MTNSTESFRERITLLEEVPSKEVARDFLSKIDACVVVIQTSSGWVLGRLVELSGLDNDQVVRLGKLGIQVEAEDETWEGLWFKILSIPEYSNSWSKNGS